MSTSDEIIVPIGNAGTKEKPYITAYMCRVAFEQEATATTARLFPSVEAHQAGCPCGKWGSVEVAVHFVRYIKSSETEQREAEKDQVREALKSTVERIRNIQKMLPTPLTEISGSKSSELIDYWIERHNQDPNGYALFWALDALRRLGDINSCSEDFWKAMVAAGQELNANWSVKV